MSADFPFLRADVPGVPHIPSGRPLAGEYADYAKSDVESVIGDDAVSALGLQGRSVLELVNPLGDADVRGVTYAPGKWTVKEVLGHLADDERIFAYRALCLARGDALAQPSFDEKLYVRSAGFEQRRLASLLAEYRSVRQATIGLLGGLPPEAWLRRGPVA